MASRRSSIALACLALLVRTPPSAAQSLEEMRRCAAEPDDQKRLACYDHSMAAHLTPSSSSARPAATAATATPPVAASAATAASEFGVHGGPLSVHRADSGPKEITAAVIGIQRRGNGERVLALDNGQSWVENEATDLALNIGDRVRIRAAALGSYMLYTPAKRFTHVTRIR